MSTSSKNSAAKKVTEKMKKDGPNVAISAALSIGATLSGKKSVTKMKSLTKDQAPKRDFGADVDEDWDEDWFNFLHSGGLRE